MKTPVLLVVLLALTPAAISESSYAIHSCPNTTTYPTGSVYGSDLRTLLTSLSNSANEYYNTASTQAAEKIQALYQCRNDVSIDECKACVAKAAATVLQKCPIQKTAVIWFDKCLLRFSNQNIVSVLSLSPSFSIRNAINVPEAERALFNGYVSSDLKVIATAAADSGSKFAVRERNTNLDFSFTDRIYSLVQCTADVSIVDCRLCLQDALGNFPSCCNNSVGGRVLKPSCSFRYEKYAFYNISGVSATLGSANQGRSGLLDAFYDHGQD